MNINEQPDVGLIFSESLFSAEEIWGFKNELGTNGLALETHEQKITIWASLDFFVPIVHIIFSPEVVRSFFVSAASNAAYDCARKFVKNIWRKVKSKKPCKVSGDKIEDYQYPIHITAGSISAVFPSNIDESIMNHYIDKLFEHLDTVQSLNHIYAIYDKKEECFKNYTETEIIDRVIKEQNEKHDTAFGNINP